MSNDAKKPTIKIKLSMEAAVEEMADILPNRDETIRRVGDRLIKIVEGEDDGDPPEIIELSAKSLDVILQKNFEFKRVTLTKDGEEVVKSATLPDRLVTMYANSPWLWQHPEFVGVSACPLVTPDGEILDGKGTHEGIVYSTPVLRLPVEVTDAQARKALKRLRKLLNTVAFADAETVQSDEDGIYRVVEDSPMGFDESNALIYGIGSACICQSVPVTPLWVCTAPPQGGSRIGKSSLQQAVAHLMTGHHVPVISFSKGTEEDVKRMEGSLLGGSTALILDNVNGATLYGDGNLASIITERPLNLRALGTSKMTRFSGRVFTAANGNGLSVGRDMLGRTGVTELASKLIDPGTRKFEMKLTDIFYRHREEILRLVFTIIRWGLQQGFKSSSTDFDGWNRLVLQPMLALDCKDPWERRAEEVEEQDEPMNEFCAAVWKFCGDSVVQYDWLPPDVQKLLFKAVARTEERMSGNMPDLSTALKRVGKRKGGNYGKFHFKHLSRAHGDGGARVCVEWIGGRHSPPPRLVWSKDREAQCVAAAAKRASARAF